MTTTTDPSPAILWDRFVQTRRIRDAWANVVASIVAQGGTPHPKTLDAFRVAEADAAAACELYDEAVQ